MRTQLTREELYEQVWTTPMRRLADEYGVSDVALAKVCRRLNVPRPGRGYWARLAAGEKIKRPGLPKLAAGQPQWTYLERVSERTPKPPPVERPDVELPEDLKSPHAAVKALARALAKASPDGHGRLVVPGREGPVVAVTRR